MKMTIAKKINLIICGLLCLLLVWGVFGLLSLGTVGNNADMIMDEAHIIDSIQEVRVSFQQLLMPANDYLITGSTDEKVHFEEHLENTRNKLDQCKAILSPHSHYVKHQFGQESTLQQIANDLSQIEQLSLQIMALPAGPKVDAGQKMKAMDAIAYQASESLQEFAVRAKNTNNYQLYDAMQALNASLHQLLMPANDYLITGEKTEQGEFESQLSQARSQLATMSALLKNQQGSKDDIILENVENDLDRIVALANSILSIPDPVRLEGSEKMKQLDAVSDIMTQSLDQLAVSARQSNRHDLAEVAHTLKVALHKAVMPANDYMVLGDVSEKETFQAHYDNAKGLVQQLSNLALDDEELHLLNNVNQNLVAIATISNEIFDMPIPDIIQARAMMEEMDGVADHVTSELSQLLTDAHEDMDEAMNVADTVEARTSYLGGAILAAMVIGGLGLGLAIAKPIKKAIDALCRGTEKVGAGDFNYQVEVKTNDELATLATAFNQMTESIQKKNEELEAMNEELRLTNEEIEASNEELRAMTEELEASNEEIRATSEELEASNEELRSTSEELEASNEELRTTNEDLEKKTEELRQAHEKLLHQKKLAAVGQLASGIGHELRNPLGVVKNAVYYIKTKVGNSDEKLTKHLNIMEREINNSNKIINDLLGFSRTKMPTTFPEDANKVVEQSLEVVTVPKNVLLVTDTAGDLPKVMVDKDQIQQVLVNLCLNGIQAMEAEGGQLHVSTHAADDFVQIKVADSGYGIPEENLNKLFDPFFTTKAKGVGLGLAVTYGIIEKHKGTIEVQSQSGQGTTFIVSLPAVKNEASQTDSAETVINLTAAN